ncbi:UNKNOWN [Stylonychia lemnae]|uniref:Uncharacterized protein n=1 Tax=Stylonychia lemnae TaxID=5949 RepID=A0A078AHW1_STYLE|nr:UNKNOWN [Stylonychia lemnae]|eukprot:CDW81491.1 UNKNOWN [Stylonychia lemnae]
MDLWNKITQDLDETYAKYEQSKQQKPLIKIEQPKPVQPTVSSTVFKSKIIQQPQQLDNSKQFQDSSLSLLQEQLQKIKQQTFTTKPVNLTQKTVGKQPIKKQTQAKKLKIESDQLQADDNIIKYESSDLSNETASINNSFNQINYLKPKPLKQCSATPIKPIKQTQLKPKTEQLFQAGQDLQRETIQLPDNPKSSAVIDFAAKIIRDSQNLVAVLDRIVPKVKTFVSDTEKAALNIVRGLEGKIQKQMKLEESGQYFDEAKIMQDLQNYQTQQMKNLQLLMSQIQQYNLNLEQLSLIKAQKVQLNIDLCLDITQIPTQLQNYEKIYAKVDGDVFALKQKGQDQVDFFKFDYKNNQESCQAEHVLSVLCQKFICQHMDRVISDNHVYSLATNQHIQQISIDKYQNTDCLAFNEQYIILGHESYTKMSLWLWDGLQYTLQKFCNANGKCKTSYVTLMKRNPFSTTNQIMLLQQSSMFIQLTVDFVNFTASQFEKHNPRTTDVKDYKILSESQMIILGRNCVTVYDYVQMQSLNSCNQRFDLDFLIFTPKFNVNLMPVIINNQGGVNTTVDVMQIGFKGKIGGLQNVKLIGAIENEVNADEVIVLGVDLETNIICLYKIENN